jgi:rhodanese-related sulfurtransferase
MMKMLKHGLLPLIVLMTVISLFAQAQSVKKLDPQNFEKKLKESKEAILIDVRTPGEYAQGHLANATLIDINSDDFKSRVAKLNKSKPVFVYCKAGSRSGSAVDIMEDMGFKEIYDLSGGITAWQKANKPIEKK